MEKRAMTGAVMAIIAVILIGATLALPWYNVHYKQTGYGQTIEKNTDFYLDHVTSSYGGRGSYSLNYNGTACTEITFQTTQLLDIVGLVFVIIGFIGAILLAVGKICKGAAVSMVATGLILSLIAPIYLYAELPSAFKVDSMRYGMSGSNPIKSFFGSNNSNGMSMSWGGGIGWWLAIVGMIFMLLALIFVAIARKPQLVAPPMAPTPPEAMPPAPPMEGQTGQTETENIPPPQS